MKNAGLVSAHRRLNLKAPLEDHFYSQISNYCLIFLIPELFHYQQIIPRLRCSDSAPRSPGASRLFLPAAPCRSGPTTPAPPPHSQTWARVGVAGPSLTHWHTGAWGDLLGLAPNCAALLRSDALAADLDAPDMALCNSRG